MAALVAAGAKQVGKLLLEAGGGAGEQDAILRAAWGRRRLGSTVAEVEREGGGVGGLGGVGRVEEALGAHVGFDEGDVGFAAAGEAEVAEGLGVDGEDAAGGAVLGGHVGDGGAVGQREVGDAGAVELDELADDAELAQGFGDGQDEVGGGGAFLELAGELEADDLRDEHGDGLAEHGGLGFDAADAPAEDAEAVDHGGVGVGADEGVGIGEGLGLSRSGSSGFAVVVPVDVETSSRSPESVVKTTRARYSRLTWWQMPMPGGTAEKLLKAVWPHLRKA